jgi:hypothetical protein
MAAKEFSELPGWRFFIEERSYGHYVIEGRHDDGRSVGREGSDCSALLVETLADAKNLPERRRAQRP